MKTKRKVLIVGIDGGTWDVLAPACDKGWMPNLNRFRQQGCWGTLRSTHPPFTPSAWVALMTGQNPGHHGVIAFHEYDPKTNQLRLNSSKSIRTETLWQKLERHSKKVVVVCVPMTYPPMEVSDILVSGFDTPSIESDFTYPSSFKEEILKEIPDFSFKQDRQRKLLKGVDDFTDYIRWLRRQSENRIQVLRMGMDKVDWDVSMIVFRSFDHMLHVFWKFLDFTHDSSSDPRSTYMLQYFKDLDELIGELLQTAQEHQATVFAVSDHGGQAKLGNIYPNRVLRDLGYLKLASKWSLLRHSVQKRWLRWHKNRAAAKLWSLKSNTQKIDFDKTRAYVTETSSYADLNLQIKNKQPNGIVPPEHAETLIEEIAAALRAVVDTDGQPLFEFVERPTKLYGLKGPKPNMPDLIIAPRNGYSLRINVTGRDLIAHAKDGDLTGIHSLNGMFGALGDGVGSGKNVNAEIIDIAPTVLAALNLPVTEDIDGSVIKEVFKYPPEVIFEKPRQQKTAGAYVYSQKEDEEITERLANLGYL